MFKSILIPTDGSDLSDKAVRQGLELARSLGSKVVAVHVSAPFHVLAGTLAALTATREEWEQDAAAFNQKVFERVAAMAPRPGRGLHLRIVHRRTRMAADHPGRGSQRVRCDLHGVSRTPRFRGRDAGKRDRKGTDSHQHPGGRPALTSTAPTREKP